MFVRYLVSQINSPHSMWSIHHIQSQTRGMGMCCTMLIWCSFMVLLTHMSYFLWTVMLFTHIVNKEGSMWLWDKDKTGRYLWFFFTSWKWPQTCASAFNSLQRDRHQMDTTVLNLVVPPKLRVARFISTLWQSYGLHKLLMTQKEDFIERKYLPYLLTSNHTLKTCSCPEAFTIKTIFEKCGVKVPQGRNATSCRPLRSSPGHNVIITNTSSIIPTTFHWVDGAAK